MPRAGKRPAICSNSISCKPSSSTMERIDLALVRRALEGRAADSALHLDTPLRQAAVAAILRDKPHGTEVLLIRRAARDGDPWSGHMAFPGGQREPEDRDLLTTAERE